MTAEDANRWNERYAERERPGAPGPPAAFAHVSDLFPTSGEALELACGAGQTSVWLAQRGMSVVGVDVSPVAIGQATELAVTAGLAERCVFAVHDLDNGLPGDSPVDLIVCHMFRDSTIDRQLVDRLASRGLLAIAVLSEVGAKPGRFRARPGELVEVFDDLEVVQAGEGDGRAWLLGRKT